jgi:hypothetical protein
MSYQAYVQTGVTEGLSTCLIKHNVTLDNPVECRIRAYCALLHRKIVDIAGTERSICTNRRHTGTWYMSFQACVQTGITQVLSTCLIKHTYKQASHRDSVHVLSSIGTNRHHTGSRYKSYQAYVQTGITQVPGTCLIKHTYKQASHKYSVQVLSSIRANRLHTGTRYMYYQAFVQTGVTQVLGTGLIKHTYKQASHRYPVQVFSSIRTNRRHPVHVLSSIIRINRHHSGTRYM